MSWTDFVELLGWRDLIDILLVAVVVYNLLLLIRGTRAVQVLIGILLVAIVHFAAGLFELVTLQRVIEAFLIVLPFAIVVLFQHEIRRALAQFGRYPLGGLATHSEVESTFDQIALAATTLASRRIGALFVIERLDGLRNYVENGIGIDAEVSYDLLINIFSPDTPLHDGAVIIQKDRIAAAACFLPLTQSAELSKDLGTRHRAAVGISEETDAVAVVVSEETGLVSVAWNGEITRDLESRSLRNTLYQHLVTDLYLQRRRPA